MEPRDHGMEHQAHVQPDARLRRVRGPEQTAASKAKLGKIAPGVPDACGQFAIAGYIRLCYPPAAEYNQSDRLLGYLHSRIGDQNDAAG